MIAPSLAGNFQAMNMQGASDRRIRTLLVDDHATFLDELAHLLEEEREMDVVGRAASGEDAVEQATALRPDLVLMDLAMPGMGGLEATRRLKINTGTDAPRVIMLSLHEHLMYRSTAHDPLVIPCSHRGRGSELKRENCTHVDER
jgi:PleD family two-component response regulator